MDAREYAAVLRKRWLSIVATMMVFVAGALALTVATRKTYTATETSFVNVTVPTSKDPAAIYQQSQFLVQRMKSYTQAVDSPLVLGPTIVSLHLPLTVKQLAAKVSATSPTDTVALQVSATDERPARAAAIANTVAKNLGQFIERFETPSDGTPSSVKVTMTKPATTPTAPSAPRPTFNLILGLLAGLAVGIGIAVVRERLSSSVETPEELSRLTGTNVLGRVLHNPRSRSPLVALEVHSAPSEAYRTIRVNLRFANVDEQPRALVVTSAAEQEGKTTVSCNLAIAMAEGGARVCLVDADLRRPTVGEVLGMDNSVGLTDVLAGEYLPEDVLVPWHDGLVTVLTSGSVPPDPNALLSSHAMENLVATLCAEFDVVVIDSPPLLPVTDALVLGKLADGVVLVTRRGRTRRSHVKAALEAIALSQCRLLGTVFNDVKLGMGPRKRRYGYGAAYAPLASAGPADDGEDDARPDKDAGEPARARTSPNARSDAPAGKGAKGRGKRQSERSSRGWADDAAGNGVRSPGQKSSPSQPAAARREDDPRAASGRRS